MKHTLLVDTKDMLLTTIIYYSGLGLLTASDTSTPPSSLIDNPIADQSNCPLPLFFAAVNLSLKSDANGIGTDVGDLLAVSTTRSISFKPNSNAKPGWSPSW